MTTFASKIKRGLDMREYRQRQGTKASKLWAEGRPILSLRSDLSHALEVGSGQG